MATAKGEYVPKLFCSTIRTISRKLPEYALHERTGQPEDQQEILDRDTAHRHSPNQRFAIVELENLDIPP